jgi:hypothetical protein
VAWGHMMMFSLPAIKSHHPPDGAGGNRFYRRPRLVSMIDEPATCRPSRPQLPTVMCNECRIGIAHNFHRNRLIGGEKRNHVRLFMLCNFTLHPFKAYFGRSTNCSARNNSSRPWARSGER